MKQITSKEALAAIKRQQNGNFITKSTLATILQGTSCTMASIVSVTPVVLAAANRKAGIEISKVGRASVMLAGKAAQFNSMYHNKVIKTAVSIGTSAKKDIEDFEPQKTWFSHSKACYSVVEHNKTGAPYLYAIFNENSASVYVMNGKVISKQEVASYCTDGAADKLLNPKSTTVNETYDVEHGAVPRTIKLENLVSVKAMKQVASV